jgi:hypothetical protein
MRTECHEIEQSLSEYLEDSLEPSAVESIRSHLDSCEACRLLLREMQNALLLCKSFPELDLPSGLVERILEQTSELYQSLSWTEYLRELIRPLYSSPKFATGACLAAISFAIVMNAFGINLTRIDWADLTPKGVLDSLHRTVYLAYDSGVRRINDLKILYQIQTKIEELRTREAETTNNPEEKSKQPNKPEENSATEHFIVLSDWRSQNCRMQGASQS